MAVDITPLVAIIIAVLAAAIILLVLVVIVYCVSRKKLDETRRWSRRRRTAAPNKEATRVKTELVSAKPGQQDVQNYGPQNVIGGRMYLPSAAPQQPMGYSDGAAAPWRPRFADASRAIPPTAVTRPQSMFGGYPRGQFNVGGAFRGLPNAQMQRSAPPPVRSRSLEDILDSALNQDDHDQRRHKQKHAKKSKHRHQRDVDGAAAPAVALPPRGVAMAYTPQLLPSYAFQPAMNVQPTPAQVPAPQPAAPAPAAAVPQPVTHYGDASRGTPAVAAGGSGQQTPSSETSWTRVDSGNGSQGSGSSGAPSGGGFGGQQAVFAPSRSAAFQANGARRRYEDQERVISAANSTHFH